MSGGLSDLCIKRPVMTVLVMFSILLAGLIGYRLLPVADLPNVDFPTIMVSASLPGASPDTMASTVATILEKEFSSIAGIDSMNSVSSTGRAQVTVQFSLDRDIDAAAQDIQSAIARTLPRLPDDMPSPPSFRKINPADFPIMFIALTSPSLAMSVLDQYAQTMSERISMLDGVAQVQIRGTKKYAVRVQLNPAALHAFDLDAEQVAEAINQQNVNIPMGQLTGPHRSVTLKVDGQISTADQYRQIIVAMRAGRPIRLSQVAAVIDGIENDKDGAWMYKANEKSHAIFLAVQKQPGSNTLEVAGRVKSLFPAFENSLPDAVQMTLLRDASKSIKASVEDVQFTLLLTLFLVVLVIFFFIRNLSATVIPSLSLPMSIFGTFAVMYLLGYSIDNISLMALTLSVGFVVDDSIVMLENIVRHLEMGKSRMQAALDGAREVGFTIISMTLSLAAIFIPLLFLGGILGRLFREFSVTIGVSVLVSCLISLTLTPMLGSRFLREQHLVHHGRFYQATERHYHWFLGLYERSLRFVLHYKFIVLILSGLILIVTVYLFKVVPKGFIPSEDRDFISVSTETAQDISWESLVDHMSQLAEIVRRDPNVERFMMNVDSSGTMMITLKPRAERELSADQVIDSLRPRLNSVPGIRAMLVNPPPINIGGRRARSLYQLTLQATDTIQLYEAAGTLEGGMRQLPGLTDISSDLQLKNSELQIEIDRNRALSLGVSPRQIEKTLYNFYGGRTVSTIYAPNDQYNVIMEVQPSDQADAESLAKLHIRANQGGLVPLTSVVTMRQGIGPLSINHSGQLPSVTLSFNVKPGVSLGEAVDALEELTDTLPSGIQSTFQGSAKQFQTSQASMGWLLGLSIIVIYIVLGILYESFIHPLTILTALPFAGFGAVLTLLLFKTELTIYAFVGIIMLIGLVKKNGIMMIDFAIAARDQDGKNAEDAIFAACIIRFRPIMMTTMAALMAGLPIAMGLGAGGESRQPLGLAVVGGLLFSQTLTLYVTPVFYIYMDKLQERFRKTSP
ncbi:MAG: efflux RND transporter permease subunit [Desulfobulbaceae bacterium]|nr:MAG: efflux RND transporter permease subunit [Desulfobulbaceae bacterium]